MRSYVTAALFLAIVPLGLMAAELQASGQRTSNIAGTAEKGGPKHRFLRQRRPRDGKRRSDGQDGSDGATIRSPKTKPKQRPVDGEERPDKPAERSPTPTVSPTDIDV